MYKVSDIEKLLEDNYHEPDIIGGVKNKECRPEPMFNGSAGISLFGHFRQEDRIPFLSSFHQPVHVAGYLMVSNLCIDLRTVDVCMAHHLGDALYRDAGGQHQVPNECRAMW